jgi:hypothetical protein
MSFPPAPSRSAREPRLDVHNANVNEDSAAANECGTVNLANGWICRRAALHHGGCTFEAPSHSTTPTR